jgi:molecular chaperone DnaJ
VAIPAGTTDGFRVTIPGEGGPGFRQGPPGNLEVVVSVAPHAFFTRRGNDLHCRFEISFAQAALGGAVQIPTLTGSQVLALPRQTESGHTFRFAGSGVPARARHAAGDLLVTVVVSTPRWLTSGQRAILEELARLERQTMEAVAHE